MAIKIRKPGDGNDGGDEGDSQQSQAAGGTDPFVEASGRALAWAQNNVKTVAFIVGGIVVAALAIWIGTNVVESQRVEASAAVSPAIWDYSTPVEGSQEMEMLEDSDRLDPPEDAFESDSERWEAIYEKAEKALEEHGSGQIAQVARLNKGAAANHLGKYDEAAKAYSEYLDGDTDDTAIAFVYLGLGIAEGGRENADAAADAFDKLAEQNEEYEGLAMYHKGQVFEATGEEERAKEVYQAVLDDDPQSPYRNEIERRLALL